MNLRQNTTPTDIWITLSRRNLETLLKMLDRKTGSTTLHRSTGEANLHVQAEEDLEHYAAEERGSMKGV